MLSKEEFKAKVISLSEKAGDNEEIMNGLKELQDSYNESIDASAAQGTGAAEGEQKPANTYTDADVMDKDGKRWSEKYSELKDEYRNRFFGGGDTPKKEDQPIDVPGEPGDRKSTRLNSSHRHTSRMPSSA